MEHSTHVDSAEVSFKKVICVNREFIDYFLTLETSAIALIEDPTLTTVHIELESSTISITGTKSENIIAAFNKLQIAFRNATVIEVTKSAAFLQCVSSTDASLIKSSLIKDRVLAGWGIRDEKLFICSNSEECTKQALFIIEQVIIEDVFPSCRCLTLLEKILAAEDRFLSLVDNLEDQVKSLAVRLNANSRKIEFAFTDKNARSFVEDALESFFSSNGKFKAFTRLQLSELHYELLKKNTDILDKMAATISPHQEVDVTISQNLCTIRCASQELVDRTVASFNKLLSKMMQKEIKVSRFCLASWVKSIDSARKLRDIDTLCKTVSKVTSTIASTSCSENPSVVDKYSLSLGWTFEHWPFLHQYKSILKKISVVKRIFSINQIDGLVKLRPFGDEAMNLSAGDAGQPDQLHDYASKITKVYHKYVKRWDSQGISAQQLKEIIEDALTEMYSLNTIVIESVGIKNLHYPQAAAAEVIFGTILDFLSSRPTCKIQEIIFVIPPNKRPAYKAYVSVLDKLRLGAQQSMSESETVVVEFSGMNVSSVNEASSRYLNESELLLGTADWSKSPLKGCITKLEQIRIPFLKEKARNKNLDIEIDIVKGEIKVEGLRANLESMKELVNSHLQQYLSKYRYSFPSNWDLSSEESYQEIVLTRHCAEFQEVKQRFLNSASNICPTEVCQIIRVQNKLLYQQYQAHKERVQQEIADQQPEGPNTQLERELWHGTDYSSIRSICSQEFNRSYAGKTGTLYGLGAYFHIEASYSMRMTKGDKEIMLVKVITGKHCLGSPQMKWSLVAEEHCHSTVDDVANPRIFAVYHDAAAYPAYIVKYAS